MTLCSDLFNLEVSLFNFHFTVFTINIKCDQNVPCTVKSVFFLTPGYFLWAPDTQVTPTFLISLEGLSYWELAIFSGAEPNYGIKQSLDNLLIISHDTQINIYSKNNSLQSVPFLKYFFIYFKHLYLELHDSPSLLEFWQSIFIKLLEIFIGFFVIILNKEKEKEEIIMTVTKIKHYKYWQILAAMSIEAIGRESSFYLTAMGPHLLNLSVLVTSQN